MIEEAMEILLVEDDPRDARLTVREIQAATKDTRIELARDGEEALDYLFRRGAYSDRAAGHPPGLILLDLKLPKVDGLEVLKEVKTNPTTRAIPVVVLTSSKEEGRVQVCHRRGRIRGGISAGSGLESL